MRNPFRRPPMVDIPPEQRESMWQHVMRRLTEARLWSEAASLAELCELGAQFCEGKLSRTPGHMGPRAEETVRIGEPLAHANRQGFLTTGSQPGEDDDGHQQRAFVEGWASPETARQLEALTRGTRLEFRSVDKLPRRNDHSNIVDVTRHTYPDGRVHVFTDFGAMPGRRDAPGIDFDRPDLLDGARYVQIHDPEWGDHSLLWDRLGQSDWDNPAPVTAARTDVRKEEEMSKPDNPGQAFLAELERDAHRYAEEARADQAFFDQADNEDLRHETANTGELLEIAEDDGDTEKMATLARSYERHLAEQRRRAAEPYDPYADAKRAEKAAADADDEWDRNPNPQTAQASRDAGQAADEAWRRAGRPDCIPPAPTASTDATNKGPDLSDLRTGRWYDTNPITTTSTGPTGGAMSGSIDDVRAGIAAANESANEGLGALQQAHASLESAQGMLLRATEGSGQADVSEANGILAQALSGIEESRQQVAAAISNAEDIAARL